MGLKGLRRLVRTSRNVPDLRFGIKPTAKVTLFPQLTKFRPEKCTQIHIVCRPNLAKSGFKPYFSYSAFCKQPSTGIRHQHIHTIIFPEAFYDNLWVFFYDNRNVLTNFAVDENQNLFFTD